MKKFILLPLVLLIAQTTAAQQTQVDTAQLTEYFRQAAQASRESHDLWGVELYGPILLVEPASLRLYANAPDSVGELRCEGALYTGILPENHPIANTSIRWNGTDWAMVMLPLPKAQYDRVSLMLHERFHVLQPGLGFKAFNPGCDHLDTRDGRLYLRLELKALERAVATTDPVERRRHIAAAMTFRLHRHGLFADAALLENQLELNEGLAEYTGEAACRRPQALKSAHFSGNIERFVDQSTFVRSFAYQTIAIYGYLLDEQQRGWNRKITVESDLTRFFIDAFSLELPTDLPKAVDELAPQYDGEAILEQERVREERNRQQIADYTRRLIEQPHLEIGLQQMQVQFNPNNIVPIAGQGSVYPTITVIDRWGTLRVTDGALMSSDWRTISVAMPLSETSGPGWTLELNEGYRVEQRADGNYTIVKQ